MKKIIFTLSLTFGLCVFGFATSQIQIAPQNDQEQDKKETKAKIERYDFRLFRFATPLIKATVEDSTKVSEINLKTKKDNSPSAFYQEKPFTFLRFS